MASSGSSSGSRGDKRRKDDNTISHDDDNEGDEAKTLSARDDNNEEAQSDTDTTKGEEAKRGNNGVERIEHYHERSRNILGNNGSSDAPKSIKFVMSSNSTGYIAGRRSRPVNGSRGVDNKTQQGGHVQDMVLQSEEKNVIIEKYKALEEKLRHTEQKQDLQMQEVQKELIEEREKTRICDANLQIEIAKREVMAVERDSFKDQAQDLSKRMKEMEAKKEDEILRLKEEAQKHFKKMKEMETEKEEKENEIQGLKDEVQGYSERAQKMEAEKAGKEMEMQRLKFEAQEHLKEMNNIEVEKAESQNELKRCKQEIDRQNSKLVAQENLIKEKLQEIAHYNEQYRQHNKDLQRLEAELAKSKQKHMQEKEAYEGELLMKGKLIEQQKHDMNTMNTEYHTIIQSMKKEKEELSKRLSEEWSKKVSADESNIENISIRSRPLNIATEYENLCSSEWLDAKTELDTGEDMDEDSKIKILCDILMMAECTASNKYDHLMGKIMQKINCPLSAIESSIQTAQRDMCDQSTQLDKVTLDSNQDTVSSASDLGTENPVIGDNMTQEHDDGSDKADVCYNEGKDITVNSSERKVEEMDTDDIHIYRPPCTQDTNDQDKETPCQDVETAKDDHEHRNGDVGEISEEYQFSAQDETTTDNIMNRNGEERKISEEHQPSAQEDETTKNNNVYGNGEEGKISEEHQPSANGISPVGEQEKVEHKGVMQMVVIPPQLNNVVGDMLRVNSEGVDTLEIQMDLKHQIEQVKAQDGQSVLELTPSSDALTKYIAACSKLAWKMSIQRPKMLFKLDGTGQHWNDKCQEPAFGGDNPSDPSSVVVFYLTPTLYHGDKLMVKGRVMTRKQEATK